MFQLGNLVKAKQFLAASKKVMLPLACNHNINIKLIAQNGFGSGHGHHEEKIKGRIKVAEKMYAHFFYQ
jgi:hypothetical protein